MNKAKRYLSIVMAVLMLLSIAPLTKTGLQASAVNRTADEAIAWCRSKIGQGVETDGLRYGYDRYGNLIDYENQCVDFIMAYYKYLGAPMPWGNGCDYATHDYPYDKLGWSRIPGAQPQKGDILVYSASTSNPAGHVAIYESEWSTYHQNFASCKYVRQITNIAYNGLDDPYWGVIRPNFISSTAVTNYSALDENRYSIKDNAPVRPYPYEKSGLVRRLAKNEMVHIKASGINSHGNSWYQLDDDNWIYEQNLSKEAQYDVRYDANGGMHKPKNQIKKQDKTLELKGQPTRKGYIFLGWAKKQNNKKNYSRDDVVYQPGDKYKKNKSISLIAAWEKKKVKIELDKYRSDLCISSVGKYKKLSDSVQVKLSKCFFLSLVNLKTIELSVRSDNTQRIITTLNNDTRVLTIKVKEPYKPGSCVVYIDACDIENDMDVLATASVYVKVDKVSAIKLCHEDGSVWKTQYKNHNEPLSITGDIPEDQDPNLTKTFLGWSRTQNAQTAEYGPGDLIQEDNDLSLYPVFVTDYQVNWRYDAGVLTIYGKGDMASYSTSSPAPWATYASQATRIVFEKNLVNPDEEVTAVGANAFRNFTKVTSLELTPRVRYIGAYAFYNCTSLSSAVVYGNIGHSAFGRCNALNTVNFPKNSGAQGSPRRAPGNTNSTDITIGAFAFSDCVNLQNIELPDSVTEIGESAFEGCISLQNVDISANVEQLNDTVFFNCDSLETIDLPDSIETIGDGTFSGCTSLQSIEIPDSVTEIGDQSFSGCSALSAIEIPESVDVIGSSTFSNCTALSSVTLPDTMDYLGDAMFAGCSSLQSIELPDEISSLGDGTFQNCTALSSVNIPDSVIEVGDSAFSGCTALQSIVLPEGIVEVNAFAFSECSNLASVDFSENLETIGSAAFSFCDSLESVSLPGSLAEIQNGAFLGCSSLQSVEFDSATALTIGDEAFSGCSALSNITLPASVVSMGNNVFSDCSAALTVQCYSTSAAHDEIVEKVGQCVTIVPVESIAFGAESYSLRKGESLTLVPVIEPANASDQTIAWSSSNEDIASVDENGNVTVHGTGTTTISVFTQDGNNMAECEVECTIPVTGIAFAEDGTEAYVGETLYPLYQMTPANASNINVLITSSDESVASIENETVKVVGAGTAVITLETEDGGFTDTYTVTAEDYISMTSLTPSKENLELEVGQSERLSATISPNNASNKDIYWFSADSEIATVDDSGTITAVAAGTTEIGVYSMDITTAQIITITVVKPADPCAGGHDYATVVTPPTCTEQGFTTHSCSRCGDHYVDAFTDALGHTEPDEHGNCSRCGTHLVDTCKWCGKVHEGFFQMIIAFFHNILASILGAKY